MGTMFSSLGTTIEADKENSVHMVLDTDHLAPGRYKIDIVAYQFNEYGHENYLDGVYPGLILEISEAFTEDNKLVWLHRNWGHVHLDDVRVIE